MKRVITLITFTRKNVTLAVVGVHTYDKLILTDRYDNNVYMYDNIDQCVTRAVVQDDIIKEPTSVCVGPAGYRFTKGLPQNLNLRTNLKLEYYIKSLNYIQ